MGEEKNSEGSTSSCIMKFVMLMPDMEFNISLNLNLNHKQKHVDRLKSTCVLYQSFDRKQGMTSVH